MFYWFFSVFFLFSISLMSAFLFIIFFLLFPFSLFYFYFFKFLRWEIRALLWDSSSFLMYACKGMFPSQNCFSCIPIILIHCIFIFIQYNVIFIFPETPFFMHYLEVYCLVLKYLEISLLSFTCWFLPWYHCVLMTSHYLNTFKIFWGFFYDQGLGSSWCMLCRHFKIICIMLLCEVFYKCELDSVGSQRCWILPYHYRSPL